MFTMADSLAFRATLDTKDFDTSLASTRSKVATGARTMAVGFAAVGTAVVAMSSGLNKFLGELSAVVDEANKLSASSGLSVESIGSLEYALEGTGVSIKEVETGLRSMVQRMNRTPAAFEELGVAVRDAQGNLRSADDVLADVSGALAGIDSATRRAALGAEIFGGRGQMLANILPQINDDLERGKELAATWYGPEAQAASADYDNAMRAASTAVRTLKTEIGTELMPVVIGFTAVWVAAAEAYDEFTTRAAQFAMAVSIWYSEGTDAMLAYTQSVIDARDGMGYLETVGARVEERLIEIFGKGSEAAGEFGGSIGGAEDALAALAQTEATLIEHQNQWLTGEDEIIAKYDAEMVKLGELYKKHGDYNAYMEAAQAVQAAMSEELMLLRGQLAWEAMEEEQAANQAALDDYTARIAAENELDRHRTEQAYLEAEARAEAERQVHSEMLGAAMSLGDTLVNLAEQYGMDTFLANKATAIAQAVVDGLAMALRWGAEGGIYGYAAAGVIALAQVAAIAAAPRPKYHSGGFSMAPDERISTVRSDEMVMTGQDQTALLSTIRAMGAGGGGAGGQGGPLRLDLNGREADALTALGLQGARSRRRARKIGQSARARGLA